MIPLIKTNLPEPKILMPALQEVLYSGYIAQGEAVDKFENEFSDFIGCKHALAVNSGTSALHIALILAGVNIGDEVISTPITAEPTNTAIKQTGAKLVWADIDLNTGNISPDSVKKLITSKTKAVMVVDYAGMPVNITAFQEIEKEYGITVIQDSAHALGAKYNGKILGNHFRFTTYSFQAIKHMTTVDGGMIAIRNKDDFENGKLIRWFGIDKRQERLTNDIQVQGYKYQMNNVTATIGLVQLRGLSQLLEKYIENGKYFDTHINNSDTIQKMEYYPGSEPSYWLYTLKVRNRDKVIDILKENGVMASPLHRRNDTHSFFGKSKVVLSNVDQFSETMLHLPCGSWLDKKSRELICEILNLKL